jgi:hypothetical protein
MGKSCLFNAILLLFWQKQRVFGYLQHETCDFLFFIKHDKCIIGKNFISAKVMLNFVMLRSFC